MQNPTVLAYVGLFLNLPFITLLISALPLSCAYRLYLVLASLWCCHSCLGIASASSLLPWPLPLPWINFLGYITDDMLCSYGDLWRSIHQHIRLRIVVLLLAIYLGIGITCLAKYLEILEFNFPQIFRVLGGPHTTSNPSQSRDLAKGFWGRERSLFTMSEQSKYIYKLDSPWAR